MASQAQDKRLGSLHPLLLLAIVTACGFALRFVNIDRWPLWNDEGLTLLFAQWPYATLFFRPVDTMPGLYYGLHRLLVGPSAGVAEARSISLICGTLLIPATWFCAKEARVPALLSSGLVALSFSLIDYSQEARAYSLLILLVVLAAAFFIRWVREGKQGDLLACTLLNLLSFYTHPVSVFWIGPVSLAMLVLGRSRAVLPLALTAILAMPEIWRVTHYPSEDFYWLLQASPGQALNTITRAALPFRLGGPVAALTAVLLGWRVCVHRAGLSGWAKSNPGAAIALLILLGAPLLIWLSGFIAKPIFMTRTILIAVPALLMALALLLRFEHRLARFVVVALFGCGLLATGTVRPKEDWRAIADRVGDEAILMCQARQAAAMRHASPGANRMLLLYGNGLADIGTPSSLAGLFDILSSKTQMQDVWNRGRTPEEALYPVWAVRSGQLDQLAPAPTTLPEAIATCQASGTDPKPAYVAD